jgi:hypothetical protein
MLFTKSDLMGRVKQLLIGEREGPIAVGDVIAVWLLPQRIYGTAPP